MFRYGSSVGTDFGFLRLMVAEARRSKSRPDRGLVRSCIEMLNQVGEVVMGSWGMSLSRRRER